MQYFDWLCMIAIPDGEVRGDYSKLLLRMMQTEFYWVVSRDRNRADDGLELRDIYEMETGEECCEEGPCTLLEMLVALAIRCDQEIMYDPDNPNRPDRWFWAMMVNLEVDKMVDKNFSKTATDDIFSHFLARKYEKSEKVDKNVKFCLFPSTKVSTKNCRLELWNQLNWWLKERFSAYFS